MLKKNIHYSKSVIVYILKLITDNSSNVKRQSENKLKKNFFCAKARLTKFDLKLLR